MTDETRPDPGCRPHARVTIPAAANGPIVLPVAVSRPAWHDLPRRLSCRTTPHAVTVPVGREDARTHCTVPRPSLWVVDQTSSVEDRESPPLGSGQLSSTSRCRWVLSLNGPWTSCERKLVPGRLPIFLFFFNAPRQLF
jgi:hypothetical protein